MKEDLVDVNLRKCGGSSNVKSNDQGWVDGRFGEDG